MYRHPDFFLTTNTREFIGFFIKALNDAKFKAMEIESELCRLLDVLKLRLCAPPDSINSYIFGIENSQ